jgi:hypothetical protein
LRFNLQDITVMLHLPAARNRGAEGKHGFRTRDINSGMHLQSLNIYSGWQYRPCHSAFQPKVIIAATVQLAVIAVVAYVIPARVPLQVPLPVST